MIKRLRKIHEREMFNPKLFGFFFNPFYTIRKGIYKGVKENASNLTGKLLDFGCGSKPYKDLFDVEEYIGLDIEESGHNHENEDIDMFYDGKVIPFSDNYFDSVFSSEVFEHVFELENSLKEINRICKPNGYLLLTVPFVMCEHEIPYDYARYTSFGIKHLLQKNEFQIVKQTKTSNYIQTVFQMWNIYVYNNIIKYKKIRFFLTPIVLVPVTIFGIVLSLILPRNDDFYLTNIVLAKKVVN